MAFTNRVATVTNIKLIPKVVDTVLNSNILFKRIVSQPKSWSGERMRFPIKYQNGVSGQSFSGFDTFSTAASERRINMEYFVKGYQKTVSLPLMEVDANNTDEQTLSLVANELTLAAQEMADEVGNIFYADGTGNGGKDFLGLGAIVDDGSVAPTIGGLSRTTYATLNSTVTASGGALSLTNMRTLYNNIVSGGQRPTLGVTTEAIHGFYERLLQQFLRINVTAQSADPSAAYKVGNGGSPSRGQASFSGLDYMGFPIVMDEKCTSGVLFFLNENFIEWRALKSKMGKDVPYSPGDVEGNDYNSIKDFGFSWTDWIKPINQYAIIGHLIMEGELLTTNPKRHGKLTGITGI